MPNEEWLTTLSTSLPRYFNLLSGRCTLILSECVVECSKAILSAQSPVLERHFMTSERDINQEIEERRRQYVERGNCGVIGGNARDGDDDDGNSDDEDDETSVLILTEYYGYDDIVREFFRSFYTGEIVIAPATYRVIFKLACQYEVSWVITECSKFLDQFLCAGNFIQNYKFLMHLRQRAITDKTVALLETMEYCRLVNHKDISCEWFNIDVDLFVVLLEHLRAPSEIYIAYLVFLWLEHDHIHRKRKFETLLSNMRIVHLPQSFINEVILKFAEVHDVESAPLYRMILSAQSYFFSQQTGSVPRRRPAANFSKIFDARCSYVNKHELEFSIPVESLLERKFTNNKISLIHDEDSGNFRLSFTERCCFVYMTNEDLVSRYPVSKVLIPVLEVGQQSQPYVSNDIEIFRDISVINADERVINVINCVAVFLSA